MWKTIEQVKKVCCVDVRDASSMLIWRVRCAQHYAVLLTTHSMTEADVLCDRIAILKDGARAASDVDARLTGRNQGVLVENDSPIELKKRYSKHMTLQVQFVSLEQMAPGQEYMRGALPASAVVTSVDRDAKTVVYSIAKDGWNVSSLLSKLEQRAARAIASWALNDASLEDVFLSVVNDKKI